MKPATNNQQRTTRTGWLFVFEGIDGSGKTTQMRRAAEALRARGLRAQRAERRVVELFEPTNGRFGQQIRTLVQALGKKRRRIAPEQVTELMELFIRDRMENAENNIRPALERGDIVLLDRYYYSTIAYQGARGLDPEAIRRRNEEFAPRPDLVLYFAIRVEEALKRIKRETDLFEGRNYLKQVKAIYDELAERLSLFHTIDANADEETVARQVLEAIDRCMSAHPNRRDQG